MKITFVLCNPNLCGGVRVVAIYAEKLRQRGHEVTVVSVPPPRPGPYDQFKAQVKGWLKRQTPPPYMGIEESHIDYVDVPHVVIDHNPPLLESDLPDGDVVVATWWETAEWVANFSAAKGVKVHFIQHHEAFEYMPVERVKATYRLPTYKVAPAAWLADLVQKEYQTAPVTLVPNSVDTAQFTAPPRAKQPRPTVGLMYFLAYWKDCRTGLAAVELAAQTVPDLQLKIFGREDLSPELPLPPGVEYIKRPPQNQIKTIYASCDVWLVPSIVEGFGLPVLEAMACRCPVIGTYSGGPEEIIDHGVNGFLAPVGDVEAIANYIIQVVTLAEADWAKLSTAAYTRAQSYTWEDATDRFEAALTAALAQAVQPQPLSTAA